MGSHNMNEFPELASWPGWEALRPARSPPISPLNGSTHRLQGILEATKRENAWLREEQQAGGNVLGKLKKLLFLKENESTGAILSCVAVTCKENQDLTREIKRLKEVNKVLEQNHSIPTTTLDAMLRSYSDGDPVETLDSLLQNSLVSSQLEEVIRIHRPPEMSNQAPVVSLHEILSHYKSQQHSSDREFHSNDVMAQLQRLSNEMGLSISNTLSSLSTLVNILRKYQNTSDVVGVLQAILSDNRLLCGLQKAILSYDSSGPSELVLSDLFKSDEAMRDIRKAISMTETPTAVVINKIKNLIESEQQQSSLINKIKNHQHNSSISISQMARELNPEAFLNILFAEHGSDSSNELQSENTDLANKLQKALKQLDEATRSLKYTKNDNKTPQTDNVTSDQLRQALQQLQESQTKKAVVEQRLSDFEKHISDLQQQNQSLQNRITTLPKMRYSNTEVEQKEFDSSLQNSITSLQRQYNDKDAELTKTKEELSAASHQHHAMEASLQLRISSFENRQEKFNKTNHESSQQVQQMLSELKASNDSKLSLMTAVSDLEKQLLEKNEQITSLQRQLTTECQLSTNLNEKIESFQSSEREQRSKLSSFSERLQQVTAERDVTGDELLKLKERTAVLQQASDESDVKREADKGEISRLRREIDSLEAYQREISSKNENTTSQLEQLSQRRSRLESELVVAQQTSSSLTSKIELLESDRAESLSPRRNFEALKIQIQQLARGLTNDISQNIETINTELIQNREKILHQESNLTSYKSTQNQLVALMQSHAADVDAESVLITLQKVFLELNSYRELNSDLKKKNSKLVSENDSVSEIKQSRDSYKDRLLTLESERNNILSAVQSRVPQSKPECSLLETVQQIMAILNSKTEESNVLTKQLSVSESENESIKALLQSKLSTEKSESSKDLVQRLLLLFDNNRDRIKVLENNDIKVKALLQSRCEDDQANELLSTLELVKQSLQIRDNFRDRISVFEADHQNIKRLLQPHVSESLLAGSVSEIVSKVNTELIECKAQIRILEKDFVHGDGSSGTADHRIADASMKSTNSSEARAIAIEENYSCITEQFGSIGLRSATFSENVELVVNEISQLRLASQQHEKLRREVESSQMLLHNLLRPDMSQNSYQATQISLQDLIVSVKSHIESLNCDIATLQRQNNEFQTSSNSMVVACYGLYGDQSTSIIKKLAEVPEGTPRRDSKKESIKDAVRELQKKRAATDLSLESSDQKSSLRSEESLRQALYAVESESELLKLHLREIRNLVEGNSIPRERGEDFYGSIVELVRSTLPGVSWRKKVSSACLGRSNLQINEVPSICNSLGVDFTGSFPHNVSEIPTSVVDNYVMNAVSTNVSAAISDPLSAHLSLQLPTLLYETSLNTSLQNLLMEWVLCAMPPLQARSSIVGWGASPSHPEVESI